MIDLDSIPRTPLAFTPTPLQETPRLAKALGLRRLYFKRDDQTGLALGGNKARKLEFLFAEAVAQRADIVVTVGAPQSNHCRMTAAAARACGMRAHLVFDSFGLPPVEAVQGNMVLDRLFGAPWTFTRKGQSLAERMQEVAAGLRSEGHTVYTIPLGGSNGRGALGYVNAAFELAGQCRARAVVPDYIVCAGGSYGTQAGLMLGAHLAGLPAAVIGVSVSPAREEPEFWIHSVMQESAKLLDVTVPGGDPVVWTGYVGDGYGVPTALSREALELVATTEGILLDHVYTAKAFAGLMGEIRSGRIRSDQCVVFLHTGGIPALFAEQRLYWGRAPSP